mgnify:CR=1 FL=1
MVLADVTHFLFGSPKSVSVQNVKASQRVHHFDFIDALRGVAVLLVILTHVGGVLDHARPNQLVFWLDKGKYGVQLFFIASAFTLFWSYKQRLDIERSSSVVRNFFIRRFFRIAPAYYVAAFLYVVTFPVFPGLDFEPVDGIRVLINVLFINGFVPSAINYLPPGGWSVGVEMMFYTLIPLMYRTITSLQKAKLWFLIALIASFAIKISIRLMQWFIFHRTSSEAWFLYYWLPNQLPVFLLGVYAFWRYVNHYGIGHRVSRASLIGVLALTLCVFFLKKKYNNWVLDRPYILLTVD